MEETEQAIAEMGSTDEVSIATLRKPRSLNLRAPPSRLPREETVIGLESTACRPCCGGVIGEAPSQRLDVTSTQFGLIVMRRQDYACQACEGAIVLAPAQAQLIKARVPTESLVPHAPVRQAQIYSRQGLDLDRSTLDPIGIAAALLAPLHTRLFEILKASTKLFAERGKSGGFRRRRLRLKRVEVDRRSLRNLQRIFLRIGRRAKIQRERHEGQNEDEKHARHHFGYGDEIAFTFRCDTFAFLFGNHAAALASLRICLSLPTASKRSCAPSPNPWTGPANLSVAPANPLSGIWSARSPSC